MRPKAARKTNLQDGARLQAEGANMSICNVKCDMSCTSDLALISSATHEEIVPWAQAVQRPLAVSAFEALGVSPAHVVSNIRIFSVYIVRHSRFQTSKHSSTMDSERDLFFQTEKERAFSLR